MAGKSYRPWRVVLVDGLLLGLVLLPFFIGVVRYGAEREPEFALSAIMLGVGGLILLVRRSFLSPSPVFCIPPLGMVFGALAGYMVLRGFFSPIRYDAWQDTLRVCFLVLGYWLVTDIAASQRNRWRWMMGLLLITISCLCWYAVVQHLEGSRNVHGIVVGQSEQHHFIEEVERPAQYGMRASGTFTNPNHFAFLLVLSVIASLGLLCTRHSGWALRIVALYALLIALPVLLLTGSRGAWTGTAVGGVLVLSVMAYRHSVYRMVLVLCLSVGLLAVVLSGLWMGSPAFQQRIRLALNGEGSRLKLWPDTVAMIKDAPMWGHGAGMYRWVYGGYQESYRAKMNYPRYAHNEFLHTFAEYGFVGFAGMVAAGLWGLFGIRSLLLAKAKDDRNGAYLAVWLAMLLGAAVHVFFDFQLHVFGCAFTLAMFAGIMGGAVLGVREHEPPKVSLRTARVIGASGIILIVVGIVAAARMGIACHFTDLTKQARGNSDYENGLRWADYSISICPYAWRAYREKGDLLAKQGMWWQEEEEKRDLLHRAQAVYQEALALNPYETATLLKLGRLLGFSLGKDEEALSVFEKIADLRPKMYWPYVELGHQLQRMGKDREALTAYERAFKLNRHDRISRYNIKQLRKKLGIKHKRKKKPSLEDPSAWIPHGFDVDVYPNRLDRV